MTDRPERDPKATWEALEQLAADADAAEIAAMNEEELDAELRAHGIDPARASLVGQDILEKAARDAGIDLAKATARTPASPAGPAPASPAARPRVPVVMALFAAALLSIVGVAVSPPHTGGHAPDNAFRARALREEGLAACRSGAWSECAAKLDEASRLDPTLDDDAVRAARAAAARALGTVPKTPHE